MPPLSGAALCSHCSKPVKNWHRRGLCRKCHDNPKIREKYSPESPNGRRGNRPDFNGRFVAAAFPTSAPPGSKEKVDVLMERARLGLSLEHPHDAPMDPEGDGDDWFDVRRTS